MAKFSQTNFESIDAMGLDSLRDIFINELFRANNFSAYIIPRNQEYRLDLITKSIYGDTQFDWILMRLNSIIQIEELAQNHKLIYVTRSNLDIAYNNIKG